MLVSIIDGTFCGMAGEMLSHAEARAYWKKNGGPEPYAKEWPGIVYVVITIQGCPILVILESWQVAPNTQAL